MVAELRVLIVIAAVGFPVIMMPILWRRMRRVQRKVLHEREKQPAPQPWEEAAALESGLIVTRRATANDELIALGDRARHSRWPLSNE